MRCEESSSVQQQHLLGRAGFRRQSPAEADLRPRPTALLVYHHPARPPPVAVPVCLSQRPVVVIRFMQH